MGTGGNANGLHTSTAGGFATDSSFSNVFGSQDGGAALDATGVGASFFGEILQPQGGVGGAAQGNTNGGTTVGGKLVSGDLDASLANLTSNLNLGGGTGFGKNFKADAQPKGPPMGSNPASNNSSQPLNNRMGANNNLNPGFNMMQPSSTSTNNQMGAVMQPVQSSPLNMYTKTDNNNVLMP